MFDFVASNDGLFLEHFDGIAVVCLLVTGKIHLQRYRWRKEKEGEWERGREGGRIGEGREGEKGGREGGREREKDERRE